MDPLGDPLYKSFKINQVKSINNISYYNYKYIKKHKIILWLKLKDI